MQTAVSVSETILKARIVVCLILCRLHPLG
jgi:hypothetical protein